MNSTAKTIVNWNNRNSNPRRVRKIELFSPPIAPLKLLPLDWSNIKPIKKTPNIIWIMLRVLSDNLSLLSFNFQTNGLVPGKALFAHKD